MNSEPVHVLIPVNRLDRAKGRLADLLDPETREALAIATLRTVVSAARAADFLVTILTAEPKVAALDLDAGIAPEVEGLRGLTPQLQAFLNTSRWPRVLILHADLPLVTGEALTGLVDSAPPPPSVTAARSRDGGTNAMLLQPPDGFVLAYGPGSFALHRNTAQAARRSFLEHVDYVLSLDLDTPADVRALLATTTGRESLAGRVLTSATLNP